MKMSNIDEDEEMLIVADADASDIRPGDVWYLHSLSKGGSLARPMVATEYDGTVRKGALSRPTASSESSQTMDL